MEFYALDGAAPAHRAACEALFAGHTIFVPAVSFANLGQLTLDLLVNSLLQCRDAYTHVKIAHIGHLLSENVPPMAGGPAFATQHARTLSLNLQVYSSATSKITIVQQRTAVMPGRAKEFAAELAAWATDCKVASVCVVAGADDMLRHDPNMLSRPIRTIFSGDFKAVNSEFLEKFASLSTSTQVEPPAEETSSSSQDSTAQGAWQSIRGAGIAPLLHRACGQRGVPFVAWIMSCAEGNNVPDAIALATQLVHYLALIPADENHNSVPLALPPSWGQLFGRRPDVSLYL